MLKLIGLRDLQTLTSGSPAADETHSVVNVPGLAQVHDETFIPPSRFKHFAQSHLDDLAPVTAFLHHDLFLQSLIAEEIVRLTATWA
jgi:hypothetical protein